MLNKWRFLLYLFSLFATMAFVSCNSSGDQEYVSLSSESTLLPDKSHFLLAPAMFEHLKAKGADTIIYYEETCINSHDQFYYFWSEGDQYHWSSSYSREGFSKSKTSFSTDSIFKFLNAYYKALKNNKIKGAAHRISGNTFTMGSIVDHYCYYIINIHTAADSILSGQIKEADLQKFLDDHSLSGSERTPNDFYKENLNSKWNELLSMLKTFK